MAIRTIRTIRAIVAISVEVPDGASWDAFAVAESVVAEAMASFASGGESPIVACVVDEAEEI